MQSETTCWNPKKSFHHGVLCKYLYFVCKYITWIFCVFAIDRIETLCSTRSALLTPYLITFRDISKPPSPWLEVTHFSIWLSIFNSCEAPKPHVNAKSIQGHQRQARSPLCDWILIYTPDYHELQHNWLNVFCFRKMPSICLRIIP